MPRSITTMPHGKKQLWSLLKTEEKAFRAKKGPHPALPWAGYDDRPRAGALWSETELNLLMQEVEKLRSLVSGGTLTATALCELAWVHGRSAFGIREKLFATLGLKKYYSIFGAQL